MPSGDEAREGRDLDLSSSDGATKFEDAAAFEELMDTQFDEARDGKDLDLSSNDAATKYKEAAEILNGHAIDDGADRVISTRCLGNCSRFSMMVYTNIKMVMLKCFPPFGTAALKLVVSECKPKAKIVNLCEKGDAFIRESMGCHIDGFIVVAAHTHVITNAPVSGRAADVVAAANTAAEVAMRLVRPGKKIRDVAEAVEKVAAAYDCKIVEGVLSHQLKQFVIDGNEVVRVSNGHTKVDDAEFEENEGELLIRSSRGIAPYKKKLACRSQDHVHYGSFSDGEEAEDVTEATRSDPSALAAKGSISMTYSEDDVGDVIAFGIPGTRAAASASTTTTQSVSFVFEDLCHASSNFDNTLVQTPIQRSLPIVCRVLNSCLDADVLFSGCNVKRWFPTL
ncbi:hypothetical protein HU200_022373 [Digitaria exilis]|uniref:Peptidase M24 domain-containing protein n=1 Tax=Digitaria exilis TaxID=1010633 RepID=A0A835C7T6_9POAL|nr:hypothetical protein HU200_022373 [Digitaria exilis]